MISTLFFQKDNIFIYFIKADLLKTVNIKKWFFFKTVYLNAYQNNFFSIVLGAGIIPRKAEDAPQKKQDEPCCGLCLDGKISGCSSCEFSGKNLFKN